MKRLPIFIAMAGAMMLALGACGSKKAPEAEETATVEAEETAQQKPVVAVVYNSPVAAGKPAFADDPTREGPLKMPESRMGVISNDVFVEIGNVGFDEHEGQRQTSLLFSNLSSDTLLVDSVLVPDRSFKIEWVRPKNNINPGWTMFLKLFVDSLDAATDYKVVFVYRNENIPAQTLHFNVHPDMNKMRADYAASQQQP